MATLARRVDGGWLRFAYGQALGGATSQSQQRYVRHNGARQRGRGQLLRFRNVSLCEPSCFPQPRRAQRISARGRCSTPMILHYYGEDATSEDKPQ